MSLWLLKTGRMPAEEDSERMLWGRLLQPLVAEQVAERGYDVLPAPLEPFIDGHMRASLDGFCGASDRDGRGVLEIKTTSAWRAREWGDDEAPDVPLAAYIQAQHYMEVTRCEWGLVAALVGGQRLILRPVQRDENVGQALRAKEAEFLGYVERDEPPAPDGSEDYDEYLRARWPEAAAGKTVELTGEDVELAHEIASRRRALREAETQLAGYEQRLKVRLGDGEQGVYGGRKVCSYGTVRSSRLQSARVRDEYPEIFAACSEPSVYRTLRIS